MFFTFNQNNEKSEEAEVTSFGPFSEGGEEPKLKDVLSDPMVHLIAKSDKIAPEELAGCVEKMRQKLKDKKTIKH